MKKVYSTPSLRFVEMENESGILSGSDRALFDTNADNAAEMNDALTDKKNLWGDEGIWK